MESLAAIGGPCFNPTMTKSPAPHRERSRQAGSAVGVLVVFLVVATLIVLLGIKFHRLSERSGPAAPATTPAPGTPAADSQAKQVSQATPTPAQTQADLERATAGMAQLQVQLDKAKSDQADLQAKLEQSKSDSGLLQTQLDSAKAESADLQAQLDKARVQATDLRAQLTQSASDRSQALAQLDQAKTQATDLETRLQKSESHLAQVQPQIVRGRRLPIRTWIEKVRGSAFQLVNGRTSFTLHINNLYLEPVSIDLTITSGDRTITQTNTIGGGVTLNLERLAPGDKVSIGGEGYDTVNVAVH